MMRVALIQQSNSSDAQENLRKSLEGIERAAKGGAQLVVLQELHRSLYFCQQEETENFDLAEPIDGPTTGALARVSKGLGLVIVGSIFERRAKGVYHNTAVVLDRGELAGTFRKMHIPDDPGFYEKFYFTPGDMGFEPVSTSVGRLGVLVCWDQWFPEAARLMALADADILIYPTAIGWDPSDEREEQERQLDAWVTIQRSHAVANGLPVVSCNRVGHESSPAGSSRGIQFWGNSFIAGPQGEVVARAGDGADEVLAADLDPRRTEDVRRIWPFFRDRRIDAYGGLLERYRR